MSEVLAGYGLCVRRMCILLHMVTETGCAEPLWIQWFIYFLGNLASLMQHSAVMNSTFFCTLLCQPDDIQMNICNIFPSAAHVGEILPQRPHLKIKLTLALQSVSTAVLTFLQQLKVNTVFWFEWLVTQVSQAEAPCNLSDRRCFMIRLCGLVSLRLPTTRHE